MPLRRTGAVLTAAAVLLAAACSGGQVRRSDDGGQSDNIRGEGAVTTFPIGEREPAPEFSGPLLDGGEFDLSDTKGDIVVLNVWGSWCEPCRDEAHALQAVHESLAERGVRFIGVNIRDTKTAARTFQDEFGITYPSIFDPDGSQLLAFRGALPQSAVPTTLVIDRHGRIAARVLGAITETSLRGLINDVLAEDDRSDTPPPDQDRQPSS